MLMPRVKAHRPHLALAADAYTCRTAGAQSEGAYTAAASALRIVGQPGLTAPVGRGFVGVEGPGMVVSGAHNNQR
jgi:hypothetical protein